MAREIKDTSIRQIQREAELEQLLAETTALYNGSQAIAKALSERQIFEAVFEQIRPHHPCEISAFRFHLIDDEPIWIELVANWQKQNTPTYPEKTRLYLPELPQARLLTTNEPIFIDDITADSRLSAEERASFAPIGAASVALLPLMASGQKFGVILVYFTRPYIFIRTTQRLWITLMDQASVSLINQQFIQKSAYRAVQIHTAAEVARVASSILNVQDLLDSTVALVQDRFSLYYVGVFLVDTAKEWAVLRAGTGKAGRIQVEKDHRLEIGGESMIGWSVANRQARIALDVGKDAVHFRNPYLPDTRSEMALPLISRDEVIGALTVQSIEQNAFSSEDITVLQTMADQLANAIANARLFGSVMRSQKAAESLLQETQALQQLSQALAGTLRTDEILHLFFDACTQEIGFEYVVLSMVDQQKNEVTAVAAVGISDEQLKQSRRSLDSTDIMADIVRTGKTEVITGWDDRFDSEMFTSEGHANWIRLFTPIVLRRENVGLVETGFNMNTRTTIEDSQIRLLRAFIDQTALALDNAQRYEGSQKAARREALIKEITTKVRASTDLDNILRTTVKELGDAIESKRTYVHLISPTNGETETRD